MSASAQTLSAAHIRGLLQPADAKLANERALQRIDDHFGSLDAVLDLAALERAVDAACARSDELNAKSEANEAATDKFISDTIVTTRAHLHTAQELSLERHALADELAALTQELQSSLSDPDRQPTLLEELETLHRKLRELESVREYVGVVHHALGLSENAVTAMRETKASLTEAHPAIEHYKALQAFVISLRDTCSAVEGGSVFLLSFLESVQSKAWAGIKEVLTSDLLDASEQLSWPMVVKYDTISSEHRVQFEKAFSKMLRLQEIGEKLHPNDHKKALYALQALVQPVALRFKYHFESDRETNKASKPELFLTHMLDVSHRHRPFLENYVQRLLDKSSYRSLDAWREFTRLLFPVLARKIRSIVPILLQHPSLLAHLIYQTLSFDAALREAGFDLKGTMVATKPGHEEQEWDGLAEVVLGNSEWFEAWLEGEKRFDDEQYYEIISSTDAWAIADQDEEEEGSDVRYTNSSRRIKALLEQVTDRYQALPRLPQRARFLLQVQLPILDQYRGRIISSLDAFENLSSALARAVPGGLTGQVDMGAKRLTSGVEGASRLVKALISARAIEKAMVGWGEEVFFLELWTEMNRRPGLRALVASHGLLPTTNSGEEAEGTAFDILVHAYRDACARAEDMIVRQAVVDIKEDLHPYLSAGWDPAADTSPETLTLPPGLAMPIAGLAAHISFLRQTLPAVQAVSLYRRISSALAAHIVQRGIIYRGRGRATLAHGVRFAAEARAWVDACRAALPGQPARRVEAPWAQLLAASRLLTVEGGDMEAALDVVFGDTGGDAAWGEVMHGFGLHDLDRRDAREILRARADCSR